MKATATKRTIDSTPALSVVGNDSHGPAARLDDVAGLASEREELAALTLDALGMIRYCNRASETLFKYRGGELLGQKVSMLLPQLADLRLIEDGQANPHLRFLCRVGHRFEGVAKDGERFTSELFLRVLDSAKADQLSLIVRPAEAAAGAGAAQAFDAMAAEASPRQQGNALDN